MAKKDRYRDFILRVFHARVDRDPSYSLRKFALDLGISVASLSLILNGKQGLSLTTARKVAKRMKLGVIESSHFCDLVESEHARSRSLRESAKARIRSRLTPVQPVQPRVLRMISELLGLMVTDGFQSDPKWIAGKLGVSEKRVIDTMKKLSETGLVASPLETFGRR